MEELLIPAASSSAGSGEARVFFFRMQADFLRYLAECQDVEQDEGNDDWARRAGALAQQLTPEKFDTQRHRYIVTVNDARKAYDKATEAARTAGLHPTHPTRLGVALNIAVFHKEVLHDTVGATRMALETYEMAVTLLHELPNEFYNESLQMLAQLKENAQVWAGEEPEAVRLQKAVRARTEKSERRRRASASSPGAPPQQPGGGDNMKQAAGGKGAAKGD